MSSRRLRQTALMAVVLVGLTSCAILDPRSPDPALKPLDWQARQQFLSSLSGWHIEGRMALQTADDAWSASIDWQQKASGYLIQLSGPLGSQAMTIQGGPGYAVIETSDGEKYIETSVNRLIEKHTGWQLPVAGLKYWALGLIDPDSPAKQVFDEQGRLSHLDQSGWNIQYKSYQLQGRAEMPRKIQLENNYFKVKLVFMNWELVHREPRPDSLSQL